jgi:NAD(P)-dependent dehydrogenase (short-subunit alcohol dehydrogenase family)
MANALENQVAIITGSTSGMGEGIARRFAKEGASVVINGTNEERGKAIQASINDEGGKASFYKADVSEAAEVESLVQFAVEQFGKVTILVPNAGILGNGSATDLPLETWHKTIGVNLNGVYYLCRFGLPELIKAGGGTVVINASIASFKGFPNHPAYCASKGALIPLMKNLAKDYAEHKIRVNALCPGPVDTPLIWDSVKAFPNPDSIVDETVQMTCMKRLGTPTDVAKAALFFASDASSWITGSALVIDGGVMC